MSAQLAAGATGAAAGALYTRALSPNPEVISYGGNCPAVVYDLHLLRQLLDNCSLTSQVQHQLVLPLLYATASGFAVAVAVVAGTNTTTSPHGLVSFGRRVKR